MKIGLPCVIGDIKETLNTEIVEAKIPLLIGTNSLQKAEAKLDFKDHSAEFFGQKVTMFRVGSGHFCIQLFSEALEMGSHINDPATREEMVFKVLVADEVELTYKQLQKLHHVFGHTSAEKLINKAGKGSKDFKTRLEKIRETCEVCVKGDKAKPRPKCVMPRVDSFNQIVTID